MCGIAGMINLRSAPGVLRQMMDAMRHRGPDGEGQYTEPGIVELGHRRLAIIDLHTGDQPQVSPDGRYVLIFNGELYNYLELRPTLEARGWQFKTTSDTEVLLAGLVLHGVDFLKRMIGMFALAFWDKQERRLLLARDRVGIKPLYYAQPAGGQLVFASELKSILCLPAIRREIDPDALDCYLALRYVPGPKTMLKGIFKFPAGHWAIFQNGQLIFTRYWSVAFESSEKPGINEEEAADHFYELLKDAVRLRMRSDVPFGMFLSGGVDSSTVLGLMAGLSGQPVRTFSIGFRAGSDELAAAERIARHFGAHHCSFYLEPGDLERLPEVAWYLDEPFPDPVVLAMHMLSLKARESVKMVLTGEGADELLSGYVHHPHLELLTQLAPWIPSVLWRGLGGVAARLPMRMIDRLFDYPASPGPKGRQRLAALFPAMRNEVERYLTYVSLFVRQDRRRLYTPEWMKKLQVQNHLSDVVREGLGSDSPLAIDRILNMEYKSWLQDNILFKQDKILMGNSLEGRVPFCDHRLVEWAARLPLRLKRGRNRNKEILQRVSERVVPPALREQRKRAFMVPLEGPYGTVLNGMIQELIKSSGFMGRGLFRKDAISALLKEFAESPFLVGKQLMALVMLELWMEKVLDGPEA